MGTENTRKSLGLKYIGAGIILCGCAAAGGIWYQGTVFDKQFAEVSAQLAEAAAGDGTEIRSEELARTILSREIAVYLKLDDKELRWTGRADLGIKPTVALSLDKDWGAAPEALRQVSGFSDRLTVTTDVFGTNPMLDWRVLPFSVKSDDGTECWMKESRLEGPLESASTISLTTGSLRCKHGEESVRIGTGRTDVKFDRDAQFVKTNTVVDGLTLQGNGDAKVELGRLTFRSSAAPSAKNTEVSDVKFVDADWAMAVENLQAAGFRADRFAFGMRFSNLSEDLSLKLAAMSDEADPEKASKIFVDALKNDGLIAEVTDCSLERNGGTTSFAGKLGIEDDRIGRFTVTLNPATYNDVPEIRDALALVVALGQFEAEGALLKADVVLKEDGITVNGKSFGENLRNAQ